MKYDLSSLPPPLRNKNKRDDYARECNLEITTGVSSRSGLSERWKKNEDNYKNINLDSVELVPGTTPIAVPVVQPMLDRINGTVYGNIMSVEPWVQASPEMDDLGVGDAVERDIQFLLQKAQFPRRLWSVLKISSCTNCGFLRPRYVNTVGLVIDVVHPGDAMIYPSSAKSPSDAKSFGHRFWLTVSQIEAKQKSGEWIDCDIRGSDDPQQYDAGRNKQFDKVESGAATPRDESIELWEIVRFDTFGDQGPMWYKCVVALNAQKLLDCRPFGASMSVQSEFESIQQFIPYSGPDYFDIRYDDEYGIFWPSGSPAQNLQQIQSLTNDAYGIWYWGHVASAFPILVISGGTLGKKVEKSVPGMIIENPTAISAQSIGVTFNGQSFPQILQSLEGLAQQAVRINQLAVGQGLKSHSTATEAASLMQMQRDAEDQYTAFVSLSLKPFFERVYELYRIHHTDILNTFGPSIEVKDAGVLEAVRFNFESAGKRSSNSPQALIGKLQLLIGMAASSQGGPFDMNKIQMAVAKALQLPFSLAKIQVTPEQAAQNLITAAQGGAMDEDTQGALGQLDPQAMRSIMSQLGGMQQGMAA